MFSHISQYLKALVHNQKHFRYSLKCFLYHPSFYSMEEYYEYKEYTLWIRYINFYISHFLHMSFNTFNIYFLLLLSITTRLNFYFCTLRYLDKCILQHMLFTFIIWLFPDLWWVYLHMICGEINKWLWVHLWYMKILLLMFRNKYFGTDITKYILLLRG